MIQNKNLSNSNKQIKNTYHKQKLLWDVLCNEDAPKGGDRIKKGFLKDKQEGVFQEIMKEENTAGAV